MTIKETELKEMEKKVRLLRDTVEELQQVSNNFPAFNRNIIRILASITMLELNINAF